MIARKKTGILLVAALAGSMTLGACSRQISPDVHTGPAAGETMRTYAAVIQSVRQVEVQESDTLEQNDVGKLLGGLAGGVAASRFGDGVGRALAVTAGAIAGAFIGSYAEQEIKRQPGLEYIVRTEDGQLLTLVQGTSPALAVGQRVFVQEGSRGRGRIIPAT